jgi:hypothetical protein
MARAFYGYSTPDVSVKSARGIFVSVFDETWLTNGSPIEPPQME